MENLYALLLSKSQNCIHIEPVEHWLSKNRQAYQDEAKLCDYNPIVIADKETCRQTADSIRPTLKARSTEKAVI